MQLLEEVKQSLIGTNGSNENSFEPLILRLDLTDIDHVQEYASKVQNLFGKIDIVINNAGISYRGRAVDTSIDVDRHVMNVNYFGHLALIKGLYRLCTLI